jgi:hypothetical protein
MYPQVQASRSGYRGGQKPAYATSASSLDVPAPRIGVFTDSEVSNKKLPFDYVATAVNFILSTSHRAEAMVSAYRQHASDWFRNHSYNGQLITYEQCNQFQEELLQFLRSKVQTTRTEVLASASTRGNHAGT